MSRDSFEIARTDIDIVELATRAYGDEPIRRGNLQFISCIKGGGGADTNPSLALYPDRNGFYCYHCGWHGTVIDFVMGWKDLQTPIEALIELNRMYPALGLLNDEMRQRASLRESYIDTCRKRTIDEHKKLLDSKKIMDALLISRGISELSIDNFDLGVTMIGNVPRLSIPQKDSHGNVVAFVTRKLVDRDTNPKYWSMNIAIDGKTGKVLYNGDINTATDIINIWKKGGYLYNLDQVGDGVIFATSDKKTKEAVLVEGHLDVIAAWELGVNNATAYGMKFVTDDQAILLEPFSCITLIPDTDAFDAVYDNVDTIRSKFPAKMINIVDLSHMFPFDPELPSVKDVGDVLIRARKQGNIESMIAAMSQAVPVEQWLYDRDVAPHLQSEKAFAYTQAQRLLKISTEPISRAYVLTRMSEDLGINASILSFVTS